MTQHRIVRQEKISDARVAGVYAACYRRQRPTPEAAGEFLQPEHRYLLRLPGRVQRTMWLSESERLRVITALLEAWPGVEPGHADGGEAA